MSTSSREDFRLARYQERTSRRQARRQNQWRGTAPFLPPAHPEQNPPSVIWVPRSIMEQEELVHELQEQRRLKQLQQGYSPRFLWVSTGSSSAAQVPTPTSVPTQQSKPTLNALAADFIPASKETWQPSGGGEDRGRSHSSSTISEVSTSFTTESFTPSPYVDHAPPHRPYDHSQPQSQAQHQPQYQYPFQTTTQARPPRESPYPSYETRHYHENGLGQRSYTFTESALKAMHSGHELGGRSAHIPLGTQDQDSFVLEQDEPIKYVEDADQVENCKASLKTAETKLDQLEIAGGGESVAHETTKEAAVEGLVESKRVCRPKLRLQIPEKSNRHINVQNEHYDISRDGPPETFARIQRLMQDPTYQAVSARFFPRANEPESNIDSSPVTPQNEPVARSTSAPNLWPNF